MRLTSVSVQEEGMIIQTGIVIFWFLFWLLSVVDKLVSGPGILWLGQDRLIQISGYFSSIGLSNPDIAKAFLIFISLAEIIALLLAAGSLWSLVIGNQKASRALFFWSILASLIIFSFFTIGDQSFGEQGELLKHTTYWLALIVSWGIYDFSAISNKR